MQYSGRQGNIFSLNCKTVRKIVNTHKHKQHTHTHTQNKICLMQFTSNRYYFAGREHWQLLLSSFKFQSGGELKIGSRRLFFFFNQKAGREECCEKKKDLSMKKINWRNGKGFTIHLSVNKYFLSAYSIPNIIWDAGIRW